MCEIYTKEHFRVKIRKMKIMLRHFSVFSNTVKKWLIFSLLFSCKNILELKSAREVEVGHVLKQQNLVSVGVINGHKFSLDSSSTSSLQVLHFSFSKEKTGKMSVNSMH